jgi:hypothetical protein
MTTLEPFPTGWWARRHMATPEPSHTGRQVWSHGTRGDTGALPCRAMGPVTRGNDRALPHQEVGLELWDTW